MATKERMSGLAETPAAPPRILIVDDGEDNRDLLRVILILPGLSGCEVTVQMKANVDTEQIPIVIVSGRGDEATRRLALSAGAVDFITKPIDRADLCRRVRSTLRLPAKLLVT